MEKMIREDAEKLIGKWADVMELDTKRQLYKDVLEELTLPVQKEKLTFDQDSEEFTLQLRKAVKNGDSEINFVKIKSIPMEEKQVIQKYKDDESVESAMAMVSKYIDQSISIVKQFHDIDISRINTVIMGFFAQVSPQKKS
jgi:hypothetical protein